MSSIGGVANNVIQRAVPDMNPIADSIKSAVPQQAGKSGGIADVKSSMASLFDKTPDISKSLQNSISNTTARPSPAASAPRPSISGFELGRARIVPTDIKPPALEPKPTGVTISPDLKPQAPGIKPPVQDIKPSAFEPKPTGVTISPDLKPQAPGIKPSIPDIKPSDLKPRPTGVTISPDLKPQAPGIKPSIPDIKPSDLKPRPSGVTISPDVKPQAPGIKGFRPPVAPDIKPSGVTLSPQNKPLGDISQKPLGHTAQTPDTGSRIPVPYPTLSPISDNLNSIMGRTAKIGETLQRMGPSGAKHQGEFQQINQSLNDLLALHQNSQKTILDLQMSVLRNLK